MSLFIHCKKLLHLPTIPDGEDDVVGMVVGLLDELDACVVLPVPHRSFEQAFVRAREVCVYHVRDHTEIPHPLLQARDSLPGFCHVHFCQNVSILVDFRYD